MNKYYPRKDTVYHTKTIEFQRSLIINEFKRTKSISSTAKNLGVSRVTIYKLLHNKD